MEKIAIVFHPRYYNSDYSSDPAAAAGRLEGIMEHVEAHPERYEIITPTPAAEEDILRAHSEGHLHRIQRDPLLYELASLSAGGAIFAAEKAYEGTPSFAVIRPPGHHASSNSCWGFCFFNNMSIALLKLFSEKKISSAFVLDFDLHTGDGNLNILGSGTHGFRADILNPVAIERKEYLREVESHLKLLKNIDIVAASAGFDQGIDDWGGLLLPEDYYELGKLMNKYSKKLCNGRRFAILEGGYNHAALPINFDAFCRGFAE
ncbi:MAG: histone deacetylase family protein [Spirochaetes bacterium]|nr:histone deacetylase family protein [Spirochaetota bacterium]